MHMPCAHAFELALEETKHHARSPAQVAYLRPHSDPPERGYRPNTVSLVLSLAPVNKFVSSIVICFMDASHIHARPIMELIRCNQTNISTEQALPRCADENYCDTKHNVEFMQGDRLTAYACPTNSIQLIPSMHAHGNGNTSAIDEHYMKTSKWLGKKQGDRLTVRQHVCVCFLKWRGTE